MSRNNIPALKTNIIYRHTYRFSSGSAVTRDISPRNILLASSVFCTGGTQFTALNNSFRLRNIKIWSAATTVGAVSNASVLWFGANNSPPIEISDSSVSTAQSLFINTAPPPTSLAKFWQVDSTTKLFTIQVPAGAIIDVELDMILADTGFINLTYTMTGSGVTSALYYAYLDVDQGASATLVPVSLTPIR